MGPESEVAPLPHAHVGFSRQWLLQRGLDPAHLCLVEALGDGMAPFIPEGALLLVSTQDQGPPAEGIYLVWIGNRLLPKRIQPEWDGGLLLRSDNPAYENQQLDAEEAASFRIFGHVLWKGQSLF